MAESSPMMMVKWRINLEIVTTTRCHFHTSFFHYSIHHLMLLFWLRHSGQLSSFTHATRWKKLRQNFDFKNINNNWSVAAPISVHWEKNKQKWQPPRSRPYIAKYYRTSILTASLTKLILYTVYFMSSN